MEEPKPAPPQPPLRQLPRTAEQPRSPVPPPGRTKQGGRGGGEASRGMLRPRGRPVGPRAGTEGYRKVERVRAPGGGTHCPLMAAHPGPPLAPPVQAFTTPRVLSVFHELEQFAELVRGKASSRPVRRRAVGGAEGAAKRARTPLAAGPLWVRAFQAAPPPPRAVRRRVRSREGVLRLAARRRSSSVSLATRWVEWPFAPRAHLLSRRSLWSGERCCCTPSRAGMARGR